MGFKWISNTLSLWLLASLTESNHEGQCNQGVRGTQLDADRLIVSAIKSLIYPHRHQHSRLLFAGKLLFHKQLTK